MRIEITAQGMILTKTMRRHIERRIHFSLGRFSSRVKHVRVRLADKNGPRRCIDKSCHIEVKLLGLPAVVVRQISAEMPIAIDVGTDWVGRTVARKINSEHSASTAVGLGKDGGRHGS